MKKRFSVKEKNDLLHVVSVKKAETISIIDINQLHRTLCGQKIAKDLRILPLTFTGHALEIFQISKGENEGYKSLRNRILKGLDTYNTNKGSLGRAISQMA